MMLNFNSHREAHSRSHEYSAVLFVHDLLQTTSAKSRKINRVESREDIMDDCK